MPDLRSTPKTTPKATRRWNAASRLLVEEYVTQVKDMMGLRDWTILLDKSPSREGTCATIEPMEGQKRAVLALSSSFLRETPDHQRHTIVHELVHCHLAPMMKQVEATSDATLSRAASTVFWVAFMQNLEYTTDGVADAMAPLLPLPSWS